MRRTPLLVLVFLSACTTDWGEPNPIFAADEWAEKGCEQNGGTCGGGFFGGCPSEVTWRVDDSLMCGPAGTFPPSCCFPIDAGPDAGVTVDAEVPTADAGECGLGDDAMDGRSETAEAGQQDTAANVANDGSDDGG